MARAQSDGVTVMLNGSCGNSTVELLCRHPVLSTLLRAGRWGTLAREAWGISRRIMELPNNSIARFTFWPLIPVLASGFRDRSPHTKFFSGLTACCDPDIVRSLRLRGQALARHE